MKVALIGASGNAGSRILKELTSRGHTVTAIVRHPEKISAQAGVTAYEGDVNSPATLGPILEGHDAVVSSVKFSGTDPLKLIEAVRASEVPRYLVVGGAGSLEISPGVRLIDTPNFPPQYKPEAAAGGAFLDTLRNITDFNWTFLSPSANFAPGERTEVFRIGQDELLTNDKGSSISMEDYAIALVDELESPKHSRQRFTVGY